MMTFLFWNSGRQANLVGRLVAEHHADVLVLAESSVPESSIIEEIQKADGSVFSADPLCQDLAIYTRFSQNQSHIGYEHDESGVSIRCIRSAPEDILLVAVHLRSKLQTSDAEQASLTPIYAQLIRSIEDKLGHRRTVLVGDLNMNPFEPGVVQATGFHAVPSHRVASRGERTVDGRRYPFFYNPMWNLFGDQRDWPPGTYYYDKGKPITYFWHIFDQVLVRPALVPRFVHQELRILSQCGKDALINEHGHPQASDHLPIVFKLDLEPPGGSHGEERDPQTHPASA